MSPPDARDPRAVSDGPPPLTPPELRWRCDPGALPFDSTDDVEPLHGIAGQEAAVEALRFGLEIDAPGQNIFVSGLRGTGRLTLVQEILHEIRPACPLAPDRLFVHNFEQPDRPRLISLPRGQGRRFKERLDEVITLITRDLAPALSGKGVQARRKALEADAAERIEAVGGPFDQQLREAGLTLVTVQTGQVVQPTLVPVIDGETVGPDEFETLRAEGKISDEQAADLSARMDEFGERLDEVGAQIRAVRSNDAGQVNGLFAGEARTLLTAATHDIVVTWSEPSVGHFVSELIEDVVRRVSQGAPPDELVARRYRVNLLQTHRVDEPCPIEVENVPTLRSLMGGIDVEAGPNDQLEASHMTIRAGSVLRADGGYLILEAKDVAGEPHLWRALVQVLRAGRLDIVPPEFEGPVPTPTLKPEPIPINVKVVLLGDPGMYAALDQADMDFANLFKVLASFESEIERDDQAQVLYFRVLARIVRDERLQPFDRTALAELLEHGVRIAARRGKLSMRFGRLMDIAREAAFLAGKSGGERVLGEHVRQAVRRTKQRADLPGRHFRGLVRDGLMRLAVTGREVGQVNGLAVSRAGPLSYGFPARITASIGPGSAGTIDIEAASELSGSIHTKGFYILGGLLRTLLRTEHPLAFDASLAFEQSYGGIDGDSASGAEICCLLSALTDIALRQDLAMTGAIDQKGNILPIGAVNEKIEGFYDVCADLGLSGTQGVIIPAANAGDLMLRHDVVEACAEGRFGVYAVDTIHAALELFTGRPAGRRDASGRYPADSLLALAEQRARTFWQQGFRPGAA